MSSIITNLFYYAKLFIMQKPLYHYAKPKRHDKSCFAKTKSSCAAFQSSRTGATTATAVKLTVLCLIFQKFVHSATHIFSSAKTEIFGKRRKFCFQRLSLIHILISIIAIVVSIAIVADCAGVLPIDISSTSTIIGKNK